MISRLETPEPLDASASSGAPSEAIAYGQKLDAAYDEYHRLRRQGVKVSAAEFCLRYPELRKSLAGLIHAEEFLDANPELLEDAPRDWPQVGDVWEGFELLAELGAGTFGRVYLARELALGGRLVAIKCTWLGAQEAAMLGRLDHPGIVPIHSIRDLPDADLTVVCMPYLGHATLQHVCTRLHARPQPNRLACELLDACADERIAGATAPALLRRGHYLDGVRWVAARVAGALAYLHDQGICHRDLKPSNILIQPDGTPRLLDFNLSADALAPQTRLGGTLLYMAPEQLAAMAQGHPAALTPKVDVFALGVILHEWLLGVHPAAPLPAKADAATLPKHLLQCYQQHDYRDGPPTDLDPSLWRLIRSCLHVDPERRPTAAEVEQWLWQQLQPQRRLGRMFWRHPLRALAAAAGVALLFALGVLYAANQPSRSQVAYQHGWQAYQNGDYVGAIDHFTVAAARGADAADCAYGRARAYQRLAESQQAEKSWEYFNQALAEYRNAHERAARGRYAAGMAYCAQRAQLAPQTAEQYYQMALDEGFSSPIIYHNLGCLLLDRGAVQLAAARASFEKALALDGRSALTHFQLADALLRQFEWESQGKARPQAVRQVPQPVRRALEHLESGLPDRRNVTARQAEQAARCFAKAIPFDAGAAARALDWLEWAVAAGSDPDALSQDIAFRALRTDPRFASLPRHRPKSQPEKSVWIRILDPIAD